MRHETCLNCLAGQATDRNVQATDRNVQAAVLISDSIGDLTHHHHTVKCDGCGRWWFDDVVLSGLGTLVPVRRDTELCGCPDGLPQYTVAAVIVPKPDADCTCTKAETEQRALPIRTRRAR